MLNLLIISSNPKAKQVQDIMQPLIKTRIDLVSDFDQGLKDVFEKRPSLVIIQDQIAGVTGESVVRHIQLLLGNSAPTFVMLHEGNAGIMPVKGLYDFTVDLKRSETVLTGDLLDVMKTILGDDGWERVAIQPQAAAPAKEAAAGSSQLKFPDPLESADELLPETTAAPAAVKEVEAPGTSEFPKLEPLSPPIVPAQGGSVTAGQRKIPGTAGSSGSSAERSKPPEPSEFRIRGAATAKSKPQLEDVQAVFDSSYSKVSPWRLILLVVFLSGAIISGGWYLLKQKPQMLTFLQKGNPPAAVVAPPKAPVPSPPPKTVTGAEKPAAEKTAANAATPLPTFVPASGRDFAFSTSKPGWERYIDTGRDIRIFRADSRIKAIQVLAAKGQVIANSYLETALRELTGSSAYRISSSEQNHGLLIQRGGAGNGSDLLLYRQRSSGAISAFVISLN